MHPRIARLAGLGAFGASGGLAVLCLLLAYAARPTVRGGMDRTLAIITWIALAGMCVALIIVHVAIGRQLLRVAQSRNAKHPL